MSNTGKTLSASGPPNGIHIEIVTGSCEASAPVSIGAGAPSSSVPAVHAAAIRPNTASDTIHRFLAIILAPSIRSTLPLTSRCVSPPISALTRRPCRSSA
jgi:hypothetical protein